MNFNNSDVSLLHAERQGANHEAANGDNNRHHRNSDSSSCHTGNEERPLRGADPNRSGGGCCLHGLRT